MVIVTLVNPGLTQWRYMRGATVGEVMHRAGPGWFVWYIYQELE